jgi:hypothetical protein
MHLVLALLDRSAELQVNMQSGIFSVGVTAVGLLQSGSAGSLGAGVYLPLGNGVRAGRNGPIHRTCARYAGCCCC